MAAAQATGRVLVADETRASAGVGEGVVAALVEHGFTGPDPTSGQPGQLRAPGRGRPTCPAVGARHH